MNQQAKKILWKLSIIAAILASGGLLFFTAFGPSNRDLKFQKVKIERGEIGQVVTATGTINPVITVLVGSQVSGTIKSLCADFNSRVKQDQVIAQIDEALFEAQVQQGRASVQNARAGLQSAEANLQNARAGLINAQAGFETSRANLSKAEVAMVDTRRTLDRNLELMKRNVIAQAALDTAQTNYDSAVAQKEASQAQMEQAKAQVESASVMSLLLGAIASISLIVGGIGIMNIMLVSVTERTREIGIRMAVGAKGRDILFQFLIESLVLSLIGGMIGIGVGVAGTVVLATFPQWPTLISMQAILLAFLFSGSVGVFFGFYPARKASLLNPIDALRYE